MNKGGKNVIYCLFHEKISVLSIVIIFLMVQCIYTFRFIQGVVVQKYIYHTKALSHTKQVTPQPQKWTREIKKNYCQAKFNEMLHVIVANVNGCGNK